MGTFDVNRDSARRVQQQNMQTHARAHQQMRSHQQDYKHRMEQLQRRGEARPRRRQARTGALDETETLYPGDELTVPRRSLPGVLLGVAKWGVIALLVLLVAPRIITPLFADDHRPTPPFGELVTVTTGTVVPTSAYNVRVGPSTSAAIKGQVQPGRPVEVTCREGGWLRLAAPFPGRYVSSIGVQLDGTPPVC